MKYENIGRSNTKISKICLGCMSFGSKAEWMIELNEVKPIVERALDLGITTFDTANAYSNGRSEEITGELLKHCRNDVVIATKVRYQMGDNPKDIGLSKEQVKKQSEKSLERLQTKFIDLYQIHRWDYETPIKETLEAFDQLVRDEKVRHIGASNMWPSQFQKSLEISNELDLQCFETMQTFYNLCYRVEEKEMLPLCEKKNISTLIYNPLAKGFLTGRYVQNKKNDSLRFKSDPALSAKFFKSEDFDILEVVKQIAGEKGVKPAQIALAWLIEKNITTPIIGATKISHVEEAVESLNIKLSSDDITRLEFPYKIQETNHLD